jgi:hypothetical protein
MPPQPIRSVRRNATAIADPAAVRRYPNLATDIAEIVALWSRVDTALGAILAYMLKAGVRASTAMYGAILSSQAQMDALEAAAKATLNKRDFELFGAVMVVIKRAGAKRHKIAHWIWAYSDQIPDALVLIDPDALLEYHTKSSEMMMAARAGDFSVTSTKVDLSHAFVYRSNDFADIIAELKEEIANEFTVVTMTTGVDDGPRNRLSALPQIREALQRIRARNRSGQ